MGPVWRQSFRYETLNFGKGVSARLEEDGGVSVSFDPLTLSYRAAWDGDFIQFEAFRWGTSRNSLPNGNVWYADNDSSLAWMTKGRSVSSHYHGYYRHEDKIIFSYEINGSKRECSLKPCP